PTDHAIPPNFQSAPAGLPLSLPVFFASRRRHTISKRDWSSDVCSSDLNFYENVLYQCHHSFYFLALFDYEIVFLLNQEISFFARSEERRVGKECRSGWSAERQDGKGE